MSDILDSIQRLESYVISEDYRGYDPYDFLMSPVFKLPILRSQKIIRFGLQQAFRRVPVNARKIFGIKKNLNPVTLGLCIQAYTYLSEIFLQKKEFYLKEINKLLDILTQLKSEGFSGICWGYEFDWEARYAKFDAFQPTIVATGIITNALYENYKITGNQLSLSLMLDSVNFLKDLNKTFEGDNFCYSYSPFDNQIVFNATMKGARLLAQVYSITKDEQLKNEAFRTVSFMMNYQNEDGAWIYSGKDARTWIDNFHTGYIIDCLTEYCILTGDNFFRKNLEQAIGFYYNNFFLTNGIAKYYNDSIYPVDSTAVAQSIITLVKTGYIEKADKIIKWALLNMQDIKGFFYYQKRKFYTNKISYMRWSNTWMLLALSYYLFKNKKN